MLHKYASESKWEDAIRLCRFVKVKLILNSALCGFCDFVAVQGRMRDEELGGGEQGEIGERGML